MAQIRDDQFHRDESFSEGDAPRPGGEPDAALEGSGEDEQPITTGGPSVLHSRAGGVKEPGQGSPGARKGTAGKETVDEEVAGEFLDPVPERHRPRGDDPEGTMADWDKALGRE